MSPVTPTTTRADILSALAAAEQLPYGTSRVVRLEELAAEARAVDDNRAIIATHLQLVNSQNQAGIDPREQLAHLARVHRMWLQEPADFSPAYRHTLLWEYKFAALALMDSPEVPLAAVQQWLDTMADEYAHGGNSMFAVHQCRHMVADHVGDEATAAQEYRAWHASPRDKLSDCAACVANMSADHLIQIGEPQRALDVLAPVISGALTCTTGPHRALSLTLLPAVATGQLALARANHLHGYRLSRRQPGELHAVGRHAQFAALTGNVGRGMEIVADHARWLTATDLANPARRGFLEGVSLVLREACAAGLDEVPVQLGGEQVSAADAHARIEAALDALTDAYDRRNGTTAVGDRSRAARTRTRVVDHLDLGVPASSARARRAPDASAATLAGAAAPEGAGHDPDPTADPATDPGDLLDAILAALNEGNGERAVELGLRLASGSLTDDPVMIAHGQLLAAEGYQLLDLPGAALDLAEAAQQAYAHAEHPHEVPALVLVGRMRRRTARNETESAAAARTLSRAAQALELLGQDAVGQLAEVSVDVARALRDSGQHSAAAAAFGRASLLWAPDHPSQAAVLIAEQATSLAEDDQSDEVVRAAFARAHEAAGLLPEADPGRTIVDSLHAPWLIWQARCTDLGSPEETAALVEAQNVGTRLAQGWLTLGEPTRAVDILVDLLEVQVACRAPQEDFETTLVQALQLVGEHGLDGQLDAVLEPLHMHLDNHSIGASTPRD